jgi:hypothetical protein
VIQGNLNHLLLLGYWKREKRDDKTMDSKREIYMKGYRYITKKRKR